MAPLASDIAATGWTLLTQATSTSFDTLFSGFTPDLATVAGLIGYAVVAIAAIAWLTAAPAPRRAERRQGRAGHAPRTAPAIG